VSWKYIVMRTGNIETPIIFPERLVHVMVADAMKEYFVTEARLVMPVGMPESVYERLRKEVTVVSAGQLEMIVRAAGGHSETLGLISRPNDKDVINSHPYTGGIVP
jgi:hypothetical protein